MTSEKFRTNPMFLRNQFKGDGVFEIPKIEREEIELENVELVGYDRLSEKGTDKIVHLFLDDYKFEAIWNDPESRIDRLKNYKAVLAPNFSVYTEMPLSLKVYNTFRSRWCGAYFQSKGIKVIPTVAWGEPSTFWFCFDGLTQGSVVAVSTVGVRKEKTLFMQGYNELIRRIKPKAVICYGEPFEEMQGKIIKVDYAKTNNLNQKCQIDSFNIKKTCGYVCYEKGVGFAGVGKIEFPGNDPTKSPGLDFEWRGKGDPSTGKGAWVNSRTGETLHPDLNHGAPFGPHWDYNYPGGGNGFRIYPDGSMTPKMFEGEMLYA